MKYIQEKDFVLENIKKAISLFYKNDGFIKTQKSKFDLVTDVDKNIEAYLKDAIFHSYPQDNIISEETLPLAQIKGRTWIIDPIDGTCNMAHGIKMCGVQCALVEDGELVMSVIVLPDSIEEYFAIKNYGAYLNDKKISVSSETSLENSIVSFGDYSHKATDFALKQHIAIGKLYPQVAKIRMYGAACYDFSFAASGKIDGTVVLTNNLWDLCPGLLLCIEAGAIVTNVEGKPFKFGDFGVILSSNANLQSKILESFNA
ncbi:MAG: inositol monophosphatase [Clostridia bacterium]|nr:inositol monophosphatase [Clostridia bacterium]